MQQFAKLVDELLCELIAEMGIDRDTFYAACERSNSNPTHKRVVQQILSVEDFVAFKRMMVKKNLQLSEMALQEMKLKEEKKARDESDIKKAMKLNAEEQAKLQAKRDREAAEEEEMIRLAIEASLVLMKDTKVKAELATREAQLAKMRRQMEAEQACFEEAMRIEAEELE